MSFRERDPRAHYQGREIQLYGAQPTFQGGSSYKADFTGHPVIPRPPGTTAGRQFSANTAPFEGNSSYKQDFTAHPLEQRGPPPSGQWQPNAAPFDGTSAYRDDFRGHNIDPSQYNRMTGAAPYNPNTAPFDGKSSYMQDFTQHAVERRQPYSAGPYQPNTAPFDGTSHYKTDFKPHALEPRPVGVAVPGAQMFNLAPFEGQTHYKDEFKAHPMEPRPPAPPFQYQPNPAPFQGSSETKDQFQPWPMDPSTMQRPMPLPPMRPSAAFEGSSTYSQDYRGWKMPPRRPALGVQMKGDRTYVLIPAEAPLPAAGKQIFTTVHDNQSEICVLVLRGDAAIASRNNVIGQFDLKGLPPGPAGSARVEITLQLDASNVLSATATDLDANRHEQWLRQGSMEARTHATDVMTL